jgi:hypothetical protein
MKAYFGIIVFLCMASGMFASDNHYKKLRQVDYSTIRDLLEGDYGYLFSETDGDGNKIIEINPGQMIFNDNGFFIFYLDVYEGMNGEGDEGIGLVYTEDPSGRLIDYLQVYTGSFGDSFQETVDVFLIPHDGFYVKQHLDGIENIEWVDGYPTGDPYTRDTYIIGNIDPIGLISSKESDYADDFSEQFIGNVNDAIIKDIRKYFGIIENGITNKNFTVQSFIENNKSYGVYSGNKYLKRISVIEKTNDGKQLIKNFYYKVNTCFFVYETGENNYGTVENRIYFFKKDAIRILSGAQKNPITGTEFELKGADSKLESESVIEFIEQR